LAPGTGYGIGPDVLSAYSEYATDLLFPLKTADAAQMFPGGNAGLARLIAKSLIPDAISGPATLDGVCQGQVQFAALDRAGQPTRMRLGSTVVWVKHEGDPAQSPFVNIVYLKGNTLYRVKARSAVMAGGSHTTRQIVRDLGTLQREGYAQFYRSPCLMINVALRNWEFLYKMGISGCRWFEGLGNWVQVRKFATCGAPSPTISPDSPIALTIKILFYRPGLPLEEQGNLGRAELLSTPFRDYERKVREHDSWDYRESVGSCLRQSSTRVFLRERW
jgi:spermidine dehydrogenase